MHGNLAALVVELLTDGLHHQKRVLFVRGVQHHPAFSAVSRGMRRMYTVAVHLAAGIGCLLRQRLQLLAAGAGGIAGPAVAGSAGTGAPRDPPVPALPPVPTMPPLPTIAPQPTKIAKVLAQRRSSRHMPRRV